MNLIDMRTIAISYVVSNAICAAVMALLWLQNRKKFAGPGFWLVGFVMQFVMWILVVLRGTVPDFVSMVISNIFLISGTLFLYIGLERFAGKRHPQIHNAILLVVFILVQTYFTVIQPNLAAREINISMGSLLLCSQIAWFMLFRVDVEMRPITRGIGIVSVALGAVGAIRIIVVLAAPPGDDFFHSTIFETLLVLTYQMLFIILTFSLALMVNRRLFVDLESDVMRRRQVEEALKVSEEKFAKAFQSSPDAVLISRLSDGCLIEVNEGFCHITGYSREEALSNSSISLGLWANLQDRERCVSALQKKHSIHNEEFNFRTKSGRIWSGLYAGEVIYLENEAHILSVVRDVTERKQSEEALRESEQKFRSIIKLSPDGITVTDEQGLITEWNQAMEQITGLKAPDVSGKPIWDAQFQLGLEERRTPELYQQIKTMIIDLLNSGQAPWVGQPLETEYKHPDGIHRFIQSVTFPIQTSQGFMLGSVLRDVTEHRRAEE